MIAITYDQAAKLAAEVAAAQSSTGAHACRLEHIGLFGSLARERLGGATAGVGNEEGDCDLMFVYEGGAATRSELRATIQEVISPSLADIIWGDDETYFYEWRDPSRATVDVELHPVGSTFYRDHPLLAKSIFSWYVPLFERNGTPIRNLLPQAPELTPRERWAVLLNDRKGLRDFEERLSQGAIRTDPRRVARLVLRNIAWAETGNTFGTAQDALETLGVCGVADDIGIEANRVLQVVTADAHRARRDQTKDLEYVTELTTAAIQIAEERSRPSGNMRPPHARSDRTRP